MTNANWLLGSRTLTVSLTVALCMIAANSTGAEEAQWIWSPEHGKQQVPQVDCHFRKAFTAVAPQAGQITIAADDTYELYVNGRKVGEGGNVQRFDNYDISRYLSRGRNLVAVKVVNTGGSTAALAARVLIKERDGRWLSHSTDQTWTTNLNPLPLWHLPVYNDSRWDAAQVFGPLGSTPPWDRVNTTTNPSNPTNLAADPPQSRERFKINREFRVEQIVSAADTGSLIAMTFNEFGQMIASREGGPLLLISDTNRDKIPETVRVYCDKVKSCQGILALNGEVFVTGDGPDGNALYRLADTDRDGILDDVRSLVKFKGEVGEHGAHGLTLGPDGMIYVVVGNHTSPVRAYDKTSPHRDFYDGDLVTPRYEDPGGHAVGIKTPGGVVLRTDVEGERLELVAGGLRNAYDLAFNADGELFVQDSDMESDLGTSWYRPTQVFHVISGAEFGWRSGWAKWPDYYVDSVPGIVDTGRGSPTGAVAYDHVMFPARYHNALFLCDWSEGRILSVTMKRSGGSYATNSEVFLQGEPLNVTDLDVGPDGALYFVTGGRGTSGGVYRISWLGTVPDAIRNFSDDLSAVIRQPQLQSAFGRQNVAALKVKLGDRWDASLLGIAASPANPAPYRTRALDLMQLLGPLPPTDLLVTLSVDKNEEVRGKAADLMGLHSDENTHQALINLLADSDRNVRRKACEALLRAGQTAPLESLTAPLASDDRHEAWAARRLLERIPADEWRDTILTTDNHRLFIQGAVALLVSHPSKDNSLDVLDRFNQLMDAFITDRDFIDMLRVTEIAVVRGEIQADDIPLLAAKLSDEFPSGNSTMNRELARLLARLQVSGIADRYVAYLQSPSVPDVDKLHVAMYLRFITSGWTSGQRLAILKFFAEARLREGGGSYTHYVMNVARDFARTIDEADVPLVLSKGAQWPDAALGALYKLPPKLNADLLRTIKDMDRELEGKQDDEAVKRLQVGVVAVLARSGDEPSMAYLREIWKREPERRSTVALGLAQSPGGENWQYLIDSLAVLEGPAAREILARLASLDRQPESPESYRQVILKGLELKEEGSAQAVALLEHWTGETFAGGQNWEASLAPWQKWYAERFPDRPAAALPVAAKDSKWNYDELLEFLGGEDAAQASAERGAVVFSKAQCVKCHRHGSRGESLGPDLTSVAKRFTRREILESVVYPSHVISDQFASRTVVTKLGRQYTGLVAPGAANEVLVLQANGQKVSIAERDIDELLASKTSSMPEGLLNSLTLDEIADLFAFLGVAPKPTLVRRNSDEQNTR